MPSRNVTLIPFYSLCMNTLFVLPVLIPYYNAIGLTFHEFLIGEAAFSFMVLAMDVPTGWISDRVSRRLSLTLGGIFNAIGYSVLLFADSLLDTVLAQSIIGIGVAFNSGSVSALLYDSLLETGEHTNFRKIEGRRFAITLYATAGSSLLGGWMFKFDHHLPLIMDVIVCLAGAFITLFLWEPAHHKPTQKKHPFKDVWETTRYALRGHPEISGIILVSTVVFCATKLMMWAQQPYYKGQGLGEEWLGVIMAAGFLAGGMASHLSHKIDHHGSNRFVLGVMTSGIVSVCLTLAFLPPIWFAIPLFLVGTLCRSIGFPRVQNEINSRVESERRATTLSTASVMVHVLFIPTSIAMGYIADHVSLSASLTSIALVTLTLAGAGFLLWRREKAIPILEPEATP